MAFNGAGTFVRLYRWVTDRNNGVNIQASRVDAEMDGMATALSNTICRDGQSTITAPIPFNNQKITGLGNATDSADAMNRASSDARYAQRSGDTFTGAVSGTEFNAFTGGGGGYQRTGVDFNNCWYQYRNSSGDLIIGQAVSGVSTDRLKITAAGVVTALGGSLRIQPPSGNPLLDFMAAGGGGYRVGYDASINRWVLTNLGDNQIKFYVGAIGDVWSLQMGDIKTYVDGQAAAARSGALSDAIAHVAQFYITNARAVNDGSGFYALNSAGSVAAGNGGALSRFETDAFNYTVSKRYFQYFIPNVGWVTFGQA